MCCLWTEGWRDPWTKEANELRKHVAATIEDEVDRRFESQRRVLLCEVDRLRATLLAMKDSHNDQPESATLAGNTGQPWQNGGAAERPPLTPVC
jgi:hypothetical protein